MSFVSFPSQSFPLYSQSLPEVQQGVQPDHNAAMDVETGSADMEIEELEKQIKQLAISPQWLAPGEVEGIVAATISIQDPQLWAEYASTLFLFRILDQTLTITTRDQLSLTIAKQVDRLVSELESKAHEKFPFDTCLAQTIRMQIQGRIKSVTDLLTQVDPQVFEKLSGRIETISDAFSLISYPKGLEKYDQGQECNTLKLMASALIGLDVKPILQKILESPLPANITASLIGLLWGQVFIISFSGYSGLNNFDLSQSLQGLPQEYLSTIQEPAQSIKNELLKQETELQKKRNLLLEECFRIAPFMRGCEFLQTRNLHCLTQLVVAAAHLPLLQADGILWEPLLIQLQRFVSYGIPVSPQLVSLYVDNLHKLRISLKQSFSFSDENIQETLVELTSKKKVDPLMALLTLQSVSKSEKENLKKLLQQNPCPLIDFLMQGGNLTLYSKLEEQGIFSIRRWWDIHWRKETIVSLKSFSLSDWKALYSLLYKCKRMDFNDLVPQGKEEKELFTRLSKLSSLPYDINVKHIYECLHNPSPEALRLEDFIAVKDSLTPGEQFTLASAVPSLQYTNILLGLAVQAGVIRDASLYPTLSVPTEPLIRAFSSLTFAQSKSWLEAYIPTTTIRLIDTLSQEQKYEILRCFSLPGARLETQTQDGLKLPSQGWLDLFGVSLEQAKAICAPPLS